MGYFYLNKIYLLFNYILNILKLIIYEINILNFVNI